MNLNDNGHGRTEQAIESATIIFVISIVTSLLAFGYPPKMEAIYISILEAVLAGAYSWVRSRGIKTS